MEPSPNNMRLALLLILALVGIAASAAPSTPTWPKAFSASVLVVNASNPEYSYFWRWFHDLSANMARLDGFINIGNTIPPIFTSTIVDENAKEEYVVLYPPNQVSCWTRAITRPLVNPDFSDFDFVGLSLINYATVNQWVARNATSGNFFSYFEDSSSREPVRFVMFNTDGHEEVWNFYEFDAGAQDPALFEISSQIKAICTPSDLNQKLPYPTIKKH